MSCFQDENIWHRLCLEYTFMMNENVKIDISDSNIVKLELAN